MAARLATAFSSGLERPAAMPRTPRMTWRKLSSVFTGMKPRIESPLPMMKPQIASAAFVPHFYPATES